mmetsp:Transcript_30432/g.72381  ORF Transcript_30432/g.72381 Transcript_30432/m.72381 type:complete len:308 (-) Transcript_30432:12-935(-)
MMTNIGHCSTRNASPSFCFASQLFWGMQSQGTSPEKSMSIISKFLPCPMSFSYMYSSICWNRRHCQCHVAESSTPMYFPSSSLIPTSVPSLLRNVSPSICLMLVWRFSAHGNWSANESPSGSSTMCVTAGVMSRCVVLPSESSSTSIGICRTWKRRVSFLCTALRCSGTASHGIIARSSLKDLSSSGGRPGTVAGTYTISNDLPFSSTSFLYTWTRGAMNCLHEPDHAAPKRMPTCALSFRAAFVPTSPTSCLQRVAPKSAVRSDDIVALSCRFAVSRCVAVGPCSLTRSQSACCRASQRGRLLTAR